MDDKRELELMVIAREVEKNGSLVLLKRHYYKHGQKLKNKNIRFQECIFIDSKNKTYLEFVGSIFPQEVKTLKNGLFRIRYMSKGAINFISTILPYLKDKKRQAELILEYSKLKRDGGYRISEEMQNKRLEIYKELKMEKKNLKKRFSVSSSCEKSASEKTSQHKQPNQYQPIEKNQILENLENLFLK